MLGNFIFIERCRKCQTFIEYKKADIKTVCAKCWQEISLTKAKLEVYNFDSSRSMQIASAAVYEGLLRDLIQQLKYRSDRLVSSDLALLAFACVELLKPEFISAEFITTESTAAEIFLLPIPLSFWREFKRGFNQSELIAEKLSKYWGIPLNKQALKRKKNTKAQHTLNKQERKNNLDNAFVADKKFFAGKQIILVDDVFTSGATLAEAARTVINAGAYKVAAITLARALLT